MNAIVSANARIRHPDLFHIGRYSIVDDFCYFSTRVTVGLCSHIASGCSIAGGRDRTFTIGDFSSLSSGVKIWCTSDDFVNDVVAIIPETVRNPKTHLISGDVKMEDYTAVGSNSVVMPNNVIPRGTVIGALSYVPENFPFQEWAVYAGSPIRYLKPRNKEAVLGQVAELRKEIF